MTTHNPVLHSEENPAIINVAEAQPEEVYGKCFTMDLEILPLTREKADRLCRLLLGFVQELRAVAELPPIPTPSHQKKIRQANQ